MDAVADALSQTIAWQPEDTAPYEQDVLVHARLEAPFTCIGFRREGSGWHLWHADGVPTHWMPLPEPPHDE